MRKAAVASYQSAEAEIPHHHSENDHRVGGVRFAPRKVDPARPVNRAPVPDLERIDRVITLAQRIGLPPPLPQDLSAMWFDPIATLDQCATTAVEMDSIADGDTRLPIPQTPIGILVHSRQSFCDDESDSIQGDDSAVSSAGHRSRRADSRWSESV